VVTGDGWRTALQKCHNARWENFRFIFLPEDPIEAAAREKAYQEHAARVQAAQRQLARGSGGSLVGTG